jgi:hypothetical protein
MNLRATIQKPTSPGAVLLTLAVCCVAGCGREVRPEARVLVRDSLGISIVENQPGIDEVVSIWRLGEAPRVEIGVADGPGEYQLFQVTGAKMLDSSRLAVLNAGTHELRVYDTSGMFLWAAGREGEGPGEFRAPVGLWPTGADSLLVWDEALHRLSVFTRDGEFVRQVRPSSAAPNPRVLSILSDGTFFVRYNFFTIPESGFGESHSAFARYSTTGEFMDSIAVYPFGVWGMLGDIGLIGSPVFSPLLESTASSSRLWVGTGRTPEINVHAGDGSLVRIIRWAGADPTVHPEDADAYWEAQLAATEETNRPRVRRMREVTPVSRRFPSHGGLVADREGNLWVQHFRRPRDDGAYRWMVFDPEGAMLATAETPSGFWITEIGPDYLIGVDRDNLGVERVRVYDLVK